MAGPIRKDLKSSPQKEPLPAPQLAGTKPAADGSALDVFSAGTIVAAATASAEPAGAEAVRQAGQARLEPAVTRDFTVATDVSQTKEPDSPFAYIAESREEMFSRISQEVLGREPGIGEEGSGPEAFRHSGRDALQAQVDEVIPRADSESVGDRKGRMGTPEDLGVSGAFGTKADISSGSAGMDLFNVGLPSSGTSGASSEFATMAGLVNGGSHVGRVPSVADGESGGVRLLIQAIAEAEAEAKAASGSGGTGDSAAPAPAPSGSGTSAGAEPTVPAAAPQAEPPSLFSRAAEWFSRTFYDRPFMGDAGEQGSGGGGNVNANAQMKQVDSNLGATPESTTIGEALKAQEVKNLETAVGTALGSNKGGGKSDPGPEGSDVGGSPTQEYMAWRAAGRERHGLGHPGSGDVDPTDEGNEAVPTVGPGPNTALHVVVGMSENATRNFLLGQPAEDAVRGGGSFDFGNLPGDRGNIDFGPDSTGAWSGNTRTESEADALGAYRPSLGISDANTTTEEEEDSDDAD